MKNMCECKNFKQIIIFSSKHIHFKTEYFSTFESMIEEIFADVKL